MLTPSACQQQAAGGCASWQWSATASNTCMAASEPSTAPAESREASSTTGRRTRGLWYEARPDLVSSWHPTRNGSRQPRERA
ncbi:hypothetical protein WJX72_007968 [[Myrmecia] bisecta]|uniref:Uncharacterized protein n=1 Tax=[Myrmecia] bisecta TaxID=41462 RepID=A0AAW1PPT2_9CHLO